MYEIRVQFVNPTYKATALVRHQPQPEDIIGLLRELDPMPINGIRITPVSQDQVKMEEGWDE